MGNKNELVFLKRNEPFTTSDVIAECAEVGYRSVQRLIENNLNDIEFFGKVRFEITPSGTTKQPKKVYQLSEEQATFLITLLKNTEPVRAFKKELVRQFFIMRKMLVERQSLEWQDARLTGKGNNKDKNAAIKLLEPYAVAQGSRNPGRLYQVYAKDANKTCGTTGQKRDQLGVQDLKNLDVIETVQTNGIYRGMDEEKYYKQMFKETQAECREVFDRILRPTLERRMRSIGA